MEIWYWESFPKVLSSGSVHFSARVMRLEAESGFVLALTLDGLVVPMWRSSPHGFASGRVDKAIGICSLPDVRFACRGRLGIEGDVYLPPSPIMDAASPSLPPMSLATPRLSARVCCAVILKVRALRDADVPSKRIRKYFLVSQTLLKPWVTVEVLHSFYLQVPSTGTHPEPD